MAFINPADIQDWQPWAPVIAATIAASVAVFFGLLQVFIAWKQWSTAKLSAKTARNKLKLDLFERRWTVYNAAKQAINTGSLSRQFPQEMDDPYQRGIAGARWVFDKEIEDLLQNRVWELLMKVSMEAENLKLNLSSQEVVEVRGKRDAAAKQLTAAGEELDRLVAPYLQLES